MAEGTLVSLLIQNIRGISGKCLHSPPKNNHYHRKGPKLRVSTGQGLSALQEETKQDHLPTFYLWSLDTALHGPSGRQDQGGK